MLDSWAASFEAAHGRSPDVWLDRVCLDVQRLEESLVALPVYLAGCRQLVVVLGPQFATRLWCAMELFVFFHMGGSAERCSILPIGTWTAEQVRAVVSRFDARKSQCSVEADREYLLGVIESAYGSVDAFNEVVRSLLAQTVSAQVGV